MSSPASEWNSAKVRQTFVDFFKSKEHTHVPSSKVVPYEDPTLLFTNAGMNQFKPVFLGVADPNSDMAKLKRAANSQKCIRAGGKHNDLDDVGKDVYHHTFFEMLGNWSFGDYFKTEAIDWAWELLTIVYGINPERLYATYFGGDPAKGLEPDHEARDIWRKYLPAERVLPFGAKENFWEMGDTGPCGPCTEIHYDRIGGRDAAAYVNRDDPDVLEIWNLVFIQFNRETDGSLRPLPAKHVDTGMGFERLTSVLQDKRSNYDTDIFAPLFAAIQRETGYAEPYGGRVGATDTQHVDMAYRVIADHIRTLTFAITDGALPSNEGRGYVLRRILRRAVRYGRQMLGAKSGFFHRLVPVVVTHFRDAFPELGADDGAEVQRVLLEEELVFGRTLDKGLARFAKYAREIPVGGELPGDVACTLYDTFGFPLDLTQLMADERGIRVDVQGFHRRMEELREISRAAHGGAHGNARGAQASVVLQAEQTDYLAKAGVPHTDDLAKFEWDPSQPQKPITDSAQTTDGSSVFTATVRALYTRSKGFVDTWTGFGASTETETETEAETEANDAAEVESVGVVLDRTCFYAEAGGQIFDTGLISCVVDGDAGAGQTVVQVTDTQRFGGFIVHTGLVRVGCLRVGQRVELAVDLVRRAQTAKNHTITHLLNHALRAELGDKADQRGSFVGPERLRFDFAWTAGPLGDAVLKAVQQRVRTTIANNERVYKQSCALSAARQIAGLRAVFGEVYPDPVRVVSVGIPVDSLLADPTNAEWAARASVEFCGGTHLDETGQAQAFALLAEEGIAKGVRRITACTGSAALTIMRDAEALRTRVAHLLQPVDSAAATAADAAAAAADAPIPQGNLAEATRAVLEATLPVDVKEELRALVAAARDKELAREKALAAQQRTRVLAAVQELAAAPLDAAVKGLVQQVDADADAKLLNAALDAFLAARTAASLPVLPALFYSAAADPARLAAVAAVPAGSSFSGSAVDWLRSFLEPCGGKAGGKPDRAQGAAKEVAPDALQTALDAARKMASS
eukprot:TRINITY_DN822_c0_g1_i1.p1 TRINITY_DN822_c0_g1~~TRINITY_DN822_c0_g1_i1.p1  ORF type:complete len:1029 (-),score=227.79 TRINITY_DN822_c0_g1_i1:349-3435(-)